jgi:hypothetical protein
MVSDNLHPEQATAKTNDLNLRAAERAHDQHAAYVDRSADQVMKDAWAFLRTLVLINGAAAIAILTFVGGLAAKWDHNLAQLAGITHGLRWFAWGVITAALASGVSYATNYFYGSAANVMTKDWQHPFRHATALSVWFQRAAWSFHGLALVLAIASLVLFAIGISTVSHAIAHLR